MDDLDVSKLRSNEGGSRKISENFYSFNSSSKKESCFVFKAFAETEPAQPAEKPPKRTALRRFLKSRKLAKFPFVGESSLAESSPQIDQPKWVAPASPSRKPTSFSIGSPVSPPSIPDPRLPAEISKGFFSSSMNVSLSLRKSPPAEKARCRWQQAARFRLRTSELFHQISGPDSPRDLSSPSPSNPFTQFDSKLISRSGFLKDFANCPGPGSYDPITTSFSIAKRPKKFQIFGSGSLRFPEPASQKSPTKFPFKFVEMPIKAPTLSTFGCLDRQLLPPKPLLFPESAAPELPKLDVKRFKKEMTSNPVSKGRKSTRSLMTNGGPSMTLINPEYKQTAGHFQKLNSVSGAKEDPVEGKPAPGLSKARRVRRTHVRFAPKRDG